MVWPAAGEEGLSSVMSVMSVMIVGWRLVWPEAGGKGGVVGEREWQVSTDISGVSSEKGCQ